MIYRHAGISLHDGKQAMVYSRLSRRLRETSHPALPPTCKPWRAKAARASGRSSSTLTTNLTSFFREDHHFVALKDDVKAISSRPLRIWCCAPRRARPYSIAITCSEALGGTSQFQMIASDIDTNVLATARRGVYSADARGLSPERLRNNFLRGTGASTGKMKVNPSCNAASSSSP